MASGANEADVVMGIEAFVRLHKQLRSHLPHASIGYGICDAGYDATHFYRLQHELGSVPVVALAKEVKPIHDNDTIRFDEDGTPLCPGSARMRRHQYDAKSESVLYYCPAKRRGRTPGVDMSFCPLGTLCEPETKMGPIVRVAMEENMRLYTPVVRGSDQFKSLYNERSGVERVFGRLKSNTGNGNSRRRYMRQLYLTGQSIAFHGLAWVDERFDRVPDDFDGLIEALESILDERERLNEVKQELVAS